MSPASPSSFGARRVPVQDRSERRVAGFLTQAAAVVARAGYEAATMTEIAARAGASIGAVYQYFPNKEAITSALRTEYVRGLEGRWASLATDSDRLDAKQLGARIVELFVVFANEHPAFFPLLNTTRLRSDPAAKRRLREQFAALYLKKSPGLSRDAALQIALVTLQTIKGLNALCGETRPKDRPQVVDEYKGLLGAYLAGRLSP